VELEEPVGADGTDVKTSLLNAATVLLGAPVQRRQACPSAKEEIGRSPVGGTSTGIFTGRVLRDAGRGRLRPPAALPVAVPAAGTLPKAAVER